jgi:hypothetical protein
MTQLHTALSVCVRVWVGVRLCGLFTNSLDRVNRGFQLTCLPYVVQQLGISDRMSDEESDHSGPAECKGIPTLARSHTHTTHATATEPLSTTTTTTTTTTAAPLQPVETLMVRRRLSNTKTPRKMAQIHTRKTRQPGRVGREMHDRGRGSGRRRRGRMGARLSSSRCRVCRVKAGSSTVRVKSARSRARKKGSRLGGWCPLRAVGVTRFQCSPLHEALCGILCL